DMLTRMCRCNSPDTAILMPVCRTACGAGSRMGLNALITLALSQLPTYQTAKNSTMERVRSAARCHRDGTASRQRDLGVARACSMTSAKRGTPLALGFPADRFGIDRFQQLGGHHVVDLHRLGDALHGHGPIALKSDRPGERGVDRQAVLVGLDHHLER